MPSSKTKRSASRRLFALAMCLSVACVADASLAAAPITDHFGIVAPTFEINEGRDVEQLVPARGGAWHDPTPFITPDGVELWAVDGIPATVHAIGFTAVFDRITEGTVQAWRDGAWRDVQALPIEVTLEAIELRKPGATAMRARHEVEISEPVRTAGLRILITEQANTDHDVVQIRRVRIEGTVDSERKPAPPEMALSVDAKYNVFDLPGPAEVRVVLRSPSDRVVHLETRWLDATQAPAKAFDRTELDLQADTPRTVKASLGDAPQGPYFFTARLYDTSGALLAARNVLVGLRDPSLFRTGEAPPYRPVDFDPPTIEQRLERSGALWGSAMIHSVANLGMPPGEAFFRDNAEAGGELVTAYQMYHVFEPLPGVYNFAWFDRLIDAAGAHGLGLEMGIWRIDQDPSPRQYWLADQRAVIPFYLNPRRKNQYSPFAPRFRHRAERAIQLMVSRYRDRPEVWLWCPHPFGWADHDVFNLYDESEHGKEAYREFLQQRYGSVERMNQAYETDFETFASVAMPRQLWRTYQEQGDYRRMTRVLDTRRIWTDYLEFYHGNIAEMRERIFALVRHEDHKRGISGINANGGVGPAERHWELRKAYRAFDGDQGINIPHYVRRLVSSQRYGLPRRHEDIAPLSPGRRGATEAGIVDRANWTAFQHCTLGTRQFNYVFPITDGSPYWDEVFANPRARSIIKQAGAAESATVPAAYLHSFRTDRLQGVYKYQNISLHRWWMMNAVSVAWIRTGGIPQVFSADGPLDGLEQAKVIVDSGSRVLPRRTIDRLVDYVAGGGRLLLFATAGERTSDDPQARFELLQRLGYEDVQRLTPRSHDPAALVFRAPPVLARTGLRGIDTGSPPEPVFGSRTAGMPVQFHSELTVPEGGHAIGWIGAEVGAVRWPHGEGEVILLAGEPGSVTEASVYEMRESGQTDNPRLLWANGQHELNRVIHTLWADALNWGDVTPPFKVDGGTDLVFSVRRHGGDRLIYFYNHAWEPVRPRLRMNARSATRSAMSYQATWSGLQHEQTLTTVGLEQLRGGGLLLPELGAKRFAVLRLSPATHEAKDHP